MLLLQHQYNTTVIHGEMKDNIWDECVILYTKTYCVSEYTWSTGEVQD